MSLMPYHGIFSGLGDSKTSAALDSAPAKQEQGTAVVLPSEQGTGQQASTTGQIAVDIFEQAGYYIIRAPIAGVRLQDLDIEVDGKVITIRGSRRQTDDIEQDQYYLQECYWGEFSRSVTLPFNIDPKKIRATFSKDSILKILIPKEDKVKIVRINDGA